MPLTGGQSALGHRVSAQSRLVRPVYGLRTEAKDDGENFLLLLGSNLILVQHISKVPGHDFKSPAVMPKPWCASLAGRLITLHGPPVALHNRFLFFCLNCTRVSSLIAIKNSLMRLSAKRLSANSSTTPIFFHSRRGAHAAASMVRSRKLL